MIVQLVQNKTGDGYDCVTPQPLLWKQKRSNENLSIFLCMKPSDNSKIDWTPRSQKHL